MMMNIEKYVRVSSLKEAHGILKNEKGACVLGGCGYLRMGRKKITTAIDLTDLDLSYIKETSNAIDIGSMTPLRDIETSGILEDTFGSALRECTEGIVGVQLRNVVTIGGTVAGRYPFSDVIPVLMALDARVHISESETMDIEKYMNDKSTKGIITKISIPKEGQLAHFASVRNSETDYAVLNCAVSLKRGEYSIFVGARPQRAVRAVEAEKIINSGRSLEEAGIAAANELTFGDNTRGSATYRKALCKTLVKRALEGVIHAI